MIALATGMLTRKGENMHAKTYAARFKATSNTTT